jgi:hypothetical protein
MSQVVIDHKYVPRAQMVAFHARQQRFALIVAHRRFGKTVAVCNDLVVRALRTQKKNGFYAYCGPYFGQAVQTAWGYLKEAVRGLPDVKISESRHEILLPNSSKIRVFGIDNVDAMRGLYFDGVVCDEFGMWEGRAWTEVIRPCLADRQGFAIFIGTPNGKNAFYDKYQEAKADPKRWFYAEIKASTSRILPESELEDLRVELDPDEYAQEMECSWTASVRGSYYGKHIDQIEERGQLTSIEADPSEPVSLAMDLGFADAAAIWFWQIIDGQVRFIDYWEGSGYDAEEVIDILELKPYRYDVMWLPHDARAHTFQSKKSVMDIFREHDAPVRQVPNPDAGKGLTHGINAVRKVLRTYPLAFDAVKCRTGIEALRSYSRKFDADKKVFADKPNHDQYSHGADAFRYACLALDPTTIKTSVEKARRKKAQVVGATTAQPINNLITQTWTINDAWKERDRQIRARASAGRERI